MFYYFSFLNFSTHQCHSLSVLGVTTIQHLVGCEVDDHSKKVTGTLQYAYNGEEFLSFDMNKERWIALHPKSHRLNSQSIVRSRKGCISYIQCIFLYTVDQKENEKKISLPSFLLLTSTISLDLPSVYLLQRTPSSPVSCLATGFYPEKAVIFWRKDGNEIHEGIEHGEILPNHDGSFQMFVDLNASKIPLKEWERYECIFHLSGVQNDLKTRLDKDVIKTNWNESDGRTMDLFIIFFRAMSGSYSCYCFSNNC
uniref:Ig-like domain-containing protein n=1 Tax=Fundulus heteroclitus TaxID=8078 RepID=A0A3Q2PDI2_FUNHE